MKNNQSRAIHFIFNGKAYSGLPGDSLAAALLRHGVHFVARSWKYHRPRGILTAGVEEPNALVRLEDGAAVVPNVPMTEIELYEGLRAHSVNVMPSLNHDLYAINRWFSPFMRAGFYYKTFMWPKKFWPFYRQAVRKSAGLGVAPKAADQDHYDKCYDHCEVLVIGGGPAGLNAALKAARSGLRVICVEHEAKFGGSLSRREAGFPDQTASAWIEGKLKVLRALPNVKLLNRATAIAYLDQNLVSVLERLTDHLPLAERRGPRSRLHRIRAKSVILATGGHERPLVFRNNDRPGIMLCSAVSTYIRRYGVLPGKKAVVATNHDEAYLTALDLLQQGAEVCVVDMRTQAEQPGLVQAVHELGGRVSFSSQVINTHGNKRIRRVIIQTADGSANQGRYSLACDLLCVSGGWNPVVQLYCQAGGRLRWEDRRACFVPHAAYQPLFCAGAINGSAALPEILASSNQAVKDALEFCGLSGQEIQKAISNEDTVTISERLKTGYSVQPNWYCADQPMAQQFVDFQNDVSVADIDLAIREGYEDIEHVKRYTAFGFGTDQGKLSTVNAAAITAQFTEKPIETVGLTTYRPNYIPVAFGALAGHKLGHAFEPTRISPLQDWHKAHCAKFEKFGSWLLAQSYPQSPTTQARDARVFILDTSAQSKWDIQGPQVLAFMEPFLVTEFKQRCASEKPELQWLGLTLDANRAATTWVQCELLSEQHLRLYVALPDSDELYRALEWRRQSQGFCHALFITEVTEQYASFILGPVTKEIKSKLNQYPEYWFAQQVNDSTYYEYMVPATEGRALLEAMATEMDVQPCGLGQLEAIQHIKNPVEPGFGYAARMEEEACR